MCQLQCSSKAVHVSLHCPGAFEAKSVGKAWYILQHFLEVSARMFFCSPNFCQRMIPRPVFSSFKKEKALRYQSGKLISQHVMDSGIVSFLKNTSHPVVISHMFSSEHSLNAAEAHLPPQFPSEGLSSPQVLIVLSSCTGLHVLLGA